MSLNILAKGTHTLMMLTKTRLPKKFKPEIYKVVKRQEEKSNSLECDRMVFRCQEKRIGRGGNLFLALPVIDTWGSII